MILYTSKTLCIFTVVISSGFAALQQKQLPLFCSNCDGKLYSSKHLKNALSIKCDMAEVTCQCKSFGCQKNPTITFYMCNASEYNLQNVATWFKLCKNLNCLYAQVDLQDKIWYPIFTQGKLQPGFYGKKGNISARMSLKQICENVQPKGQYEVKIVGPPEKAKENRWKPTATVKAFKVTPTYKVKPASATKRPVSASDGKKKNGTLLKIATKNNTSLEKKNQHQQKSATRILKNSSKSPKALLFHGYQKRNETKVPATSKSSSMAVRKDASMHHVTHAFKRNTSSKKKMNMINTTKGTASTKKGIVKLNSSRNPNFWEKIPSRFSTSRSRKVSNSMNRTMTTKKEYSFGSHRHPNATTKKGSSVINKDLRNPNRTTFNANTRRQSRASLKSGYTKITKAGTHSNLTTRRNSSVTKAYNVSSKIHGKSTPIGSTNKSKGICKGKGNRRCDPPLTGNPCIRTMSISCSYCHIGSRENYLEQLRNDITVQCQMRTICRCVEPGCTPPGRRFSVCDLSSSEPREFGDNYRLWKDSCRRDTRCSYAQVSDREERRTYLIMYKNAVFPGVHLFPPTMPMSQQPNSITVEEYCRQKRFVFDSSLTCADWNENVITPAPPDLGENPECVKSSYRLHAQITCSNCGTDPPTTIRTLSESLEVECAIADICQCTGSRCTKPQEYFALCDLTHYDQSLDAFQVNHYGPWTVKCRNEKKCKFPQATARGTSYLLHYGGTVFSGRYQYRGNREQDGYTLPEGAAKVKNYCGLKNFALDRTKICKKGEASSTMLEIPNSLDCIKSQYVQRATISCSFCEDETYDGEIRLLSKNVFDVACGIADICDCSYPNCTKPTGYLALCDLSDMDNFDRVYGLWVAACNRENRCSYVQATGRTTYLIHYRGWVYRGRHRFTTGQTRIFHLPQAVAVRDYCAQEQFVINRTKICNTTYPTMAPPRRRPTTATPMTTIPMTTLPPEPDDKKLYCTSCPDNKLGVLSPYAQIPCTIRTYKCPKLTFQYCDANIMNEQSNFFTNMANDCQTTLGCKYVQIRDQRNNSHVIFYAGLIHTGYMYISDNITAIIENTITPSRLCNQLTVPGGFNITLITTMFCQNCATPTDNFSWKYPKQREMITCRMKDMVCQCNQAANCPRDQQYFTFCSSQSLDMGRLRRICSAENCKNPQVFGADESWYLIERDDYVQPGLSLGGVTMVQAVLASSDRISYFCSNFDSYRVINAVNLRIACIDCRVPPTNTRYTVQETNTYTIYRTELLAPCKWSWLICPECFGYNTIFCPDGRDRNDAKICDVSAADEATYSSWETACTSCRHIQVMDNDKLHLIYYGENFFSGYYMNSHQQEILLESSASSKSDFCQRFFEQRVAAVNRWQASRNPGKICYNCGLRKNRLH